MTTKALRDLNVARGSERKNESCSKGNLLNANPDECQNKNPSSLAATSIKESEVVAAGGDIGTIEIEYIESENLNDVDDVDAILQTLLDGLDSKDWIAVCEALNNVRRLSIFHKEAMDEMQRGKVVLLVVKSLKNPRSALCKTAIMTSEDLFNAYNDQIVESFEPLLLQLLLKASQDKRFVCEAAEKALVAMTNSISPSLLLPKLQPYLKHKNPRVRAKASTCFSHCVPRLGTEGIRVYGMDKLIQVAASQLSDHLPESREAARTLLLELQSVYEKLQKHPLVEESEQMETVSWELFCQSKLSALNALAVLRVTNVAKEGPVLGS